MAEQVRLRFVFRGAVQGVGFRPTVYRCAVELGLTGFVQNLRSEVAVEVQGSGPAVGRFGPRLAEMLPAAARLDETESSAMATVADEAVFRIAASASSAWLLPPVPPDLATCADCRRELFDPADRRYLYPFVSCTCCGPRYTILEDTPFDRGTTSMRDFPLCPSCLREYEDPRDRRFHAQVTSCPACGPRLALRGADGSEAPGDPVLRAIEALAAGLVVAVQGVGGFQLAADPRSEAALLRLRRDKERERKPLALMAADLAAAERLCEVDEASRAELASARAPIIILPAREGRRLRLVSPTSTLGLMLPCTPLHLLLFFHPRAGAAFEALVMTSGNARGEPMVIRPEEAIARLAGSADLFLVHDRRILHRADDSVVRPVLQCAGAGAGRGARGGAFRGHCQFRRARGYVPDPVRLDVDLARRVLAVGGDLKSAPALGFGRDIQLAPFVGDLEDPATRDDFDAHVRRFLRLYRIEPDEIAYDPHPLYYSTRWALAAQAGSRVAVQHHHAHLLSVMAEHGLPECIGMALDGTGYGSDGTVWGGEFLHATRGSFRRLGHFASFRLPGGDAAVLRPIRIAFALLEDRSGLAGGPPPLQGIGPDEAALLRAMVASGTNAPLSSSLGRLFDAAAAVLGLVERTSYEGEGPMLLESCACEARRTRAAGGDLVPLAGADPFTLDARPLIEALARRRDREGAPALALLFHRQIAAACLAAASAMRAAAGIRTLALSGGVFQNALLRELLIPQLLSAGFDVYTNVRVPPGDGGLAVGQAYHLTETAPGAAHLSTA